MDWGLEIKILRSKCLFFIQEFHVLNNVADFHGNLYECYAVDGQFPLMSCSISVDAQIHEVGGIIVTFNRVCHMNTLLNTCEPPHPDALKKYLVRLF